MFLQNAIKIGFSEFRLMKESATFLQSALKLGHSVLHHINFSDSGKIHWSGSYRFC